MDGEGREDAVAVAGGVRLVRLDPRALGRYLIQALAAEEDRFDLWLPIAFGAGIALYFTLPQEPSALVAAAVVAAILAILARSAWLRRTAWPALMIALGLAGFAAGKAQVAMTDNRLLEATTGTVTVTGVVRDREPLGGRLRAIIDVEAIEGLKASAWPGRVRLSFGRNVDLPLGGRFRVKARLYPLGGPVAPGAWNPDRTLWLAGIGATGHAVGKPDLIAAEGGGVWAAIDGLRDAIAQRIRQVLPAETAGVAIALTVGERGEIARKDNDALRISGLAHILSISGLHMSLVAGGVFWVVRALLALSPTLAAGFAIKKWAVLAALVAAVGYLLLSGASVATQRAFIMLAVMGIAVLLDRPAISMRNLAIAAFVVLMVNPETVTGASFQMSFLAVASLIAFYEAVSAWRAGREHRWQGRGPAWRAMRAIWLFLAATVATTLVAGTATALPAAYHFHRVSFYGVLANAAGLPLVSLVVMPAATLSVLAMPFGLEALPLWAMGKGIEGVLWVAHDVAGLPGSNHDVSAMPATAALVMTLGLLWLALWRGRVRLLGIAILAGGALLSSWREAPDVLIDRFAGTVAVRNGQGELVPAPGRRGRYAVESWLRADGDGATLTEAAERSGWQCAAGTCTATVAGLSIAYFREEKAAIDCSGRDIVIAAFPLRGRCRNVRLRIDRFDVWREGAHALFFKGGGIRMLTAHGTSGDRPWVVKPVARRLILEAPTPESRTAPDTEGEDAASEEETEPQ